MIPVEDAAGGAASVFHHQAEGTPKQHADEIADVEDDRNQKQMYMAEDAGGMQCAKRRNQQRPDDKHSESAPSGIDNVHFKRIPIDFFRNRSEVLTEHLERTNGQAALDREELSEHIEHPDKPQKMKKGWLVKEAQPFDRRENIGL